MVSDHHQDILGRTMWVFIAFYIISLAYELQQEGQKGDQTLIITAPFIFFRDIIVSCFQGLLGFFTHFENVGENFNKFFLSIIEMLAFFCGQIKQLFLFFLHFLETILKAPFELIMNFSQYMEELFRTLSNLIYFLYQLLLAILSPVWDQVKNVIPWILNLLRFPLRSLYNIGIFLFNLTKSIAKGAAKAANAVVNSIFTILKKISQLSFLRFFYLLFNPFRWLLDLLKMLYLQFDLISFLKKVLEILIKLPHYIYIAICDFLNLIVTFIQRIFRFICETLIWMFFDLLNLRNLAKYISECLKPLFNILYEIGKYLLNIFMKIVVLPYRFFIFLINFLKHPIQTIIDGFYYLVDLMRQFLAVLIRIIESSIVQFILGIFKKPFELLKRLLSSFSFRIILRALRIPINAFKYLGKAISAIVEAIANSIVSIVKSIGDGLYFLFTLLSNLSLRKLIYYLLAPIRLLLQILEDLAKIPFLRIIVKIIKVIIYIPTYAINLILRVLYFLFESFISFFSKGISFRNIVDMWDNVCWPRDSEYCKQVLAKAQNNANAGNQYYQYDDYQYA